MKIYSMGLNYVHSSQFSIHRPFGSGDYLFLYLKTPAIFILEGKEVFADKNSVILYNKGTPQQYYANGDSYANDFIHFNSEGEWELKCLPFDTLLVLPVSKQINKIIKDVYTEFISKNANKNESIDLLLKLLFVKVHELAACKPSDTRLFGYYDSLLNLRSKIYRHPEKKWSVAILSHEANLSPSHFQKLYKQTFGTTCISDVIACKMQYAKACLASSCDTIREISEQCGYENEEHFMRQFKQIEGITPTEYRKRMRG